MVSLPSFAIWTLSAQNINNAPITQTIVGGALPIYLQFVMLSYGLQDNLCEIITGKKTAEIKHEIY